MSLEANTPIEIRPNPLKLSLDALGGDSSAYPLGQTLAFSATANQNAYLYCYYQDADQNVARIFPNQFDPDPYVIAGKPVSIPGDNAGFDIVLDRPGARERVACLASEVEVGLRLPPSLKTADLVPLPVSSVDEVVSALPEARQAERGRSQARHHRQPVTGSAGWLDFGRCRSEPAEGFRSSSEREPSGVSGRKSGMSWASIQSSGGYADPHLSTS